MHFWLLTLITLLRKIIWERCRPSCSTHVRRLSSKFCMTFTTISFGTVAISSWMETLNRRMYEVCARGPANRYFTQCIVITWYYKCARGKGYGIFSKPPNDVARQIGSVLKTFQHPARRRGWTYQCARCHGVPQTGILHSALWLHDITNMHGITGYSKLYYYTVCCWQQLLIICTVARFGSMGYRKLDYYIMCCWCGRRQGNVTSRHIDRLAAPTCCAVHVLTSRSSLTWPWWISPRSSIIC